MNPWHGVKGLPRGMWVLFAATLINRTGTMFLPFLVLYQTRHLGFTVAAAGRTLAIYGLGALVAAPLAGRLCDRFGATRVMKASLLATGVSLLVFPLWKSTFAVSFAALAVALVNEGFRPASLAIVSSLVAPERRRAAFSLSRLAINLGMSVGPAAGGFLAAYSFPALFAVNGTTSLLAFLTLLLFPIHEAEEAHAASRAGAAAASAAEGAGEIRPRAALADPVLLYFLLAMIPVGIVFFQHEAAMALFLVRDLGMKESVYGLLFTLNTVLIVLLEVPLNTAMSHWPHRRSLALGSLLVGAGFGVFGLSHGLTGVTVGVVIWTFGEMVLIPSMSAYAADIAPANRRGAYMGLYSMAFNLAFAVGPWLGTEILQRAGSRVLWAAMFGLGLLSTALMARVAERAPHAA
jgi:predicted MFS family arabinose efflux permease